MSKFGPRRTLAKTFPLPGNSRETLSKCKSCHKYKSCMEYTEDKDVCIRCKRHRVFFRKDNPPGMHPPSFLPSSPPSSPPLIKSSSSSSSPASSPPSSPTSSPLSSPPSSPPSSPLSSASPSTSPWSSPPSSPASSPQSKSKIIRIDDGSHYSPYDLVNDAGSTLCYACGCREYEKLMLAYDGIWCKKHQGLAKHLYETSRSTGKVALVSILKSSSFRKVLTSENLAEIHKIVYAYKIKEQDYINLWFAPMSGFN